MFTYAPNSPMDDQLWAEEFGRQLGKPVAITRRGKVVARLNPSGSPSGLSSQAPWEQLRALGGRLLASPGESALREEDFEAFR